jgi:hypothetical protein
VGEVYQFYKHFQLNTVGNKVAFKTVGNKVAFKTVGNKVAFKTVGNKVAFKKQIISRRLS